MPIPKIAPRDNFKAQTKRLLAERVAFRCCFPNCNIITIGPNSTQDRKSITMGEAAHIHAASDGGPRPFPEMSKEERISYENGIWLCRNHAKLIDADYETYSAGTLKQWKETAEAETYRQLRDMEKGAVSLPTTLICLDVDLMFEGVWKSVENDTWTIVVKKYIFGNDQKLRDFSENNGSKVMLNYIIIESQGDGRLLKDSLSWKMNENNETEIKVQVHPKVVRKDPKTIGSDLATGPDGDILMEDGDFKLVGGMQLAAQIIERNLSLPLGGWRGNLLLGSFFSMYYRQFENNLPLLNRIIKIEITRLITIPPYQSGTGAEEPELNFINRISEVKVGRESNGIVPLFLSLEWGDGTFFSDELHVRLYKGTGADEKFELPDYVKELFEPKPIKKLKNMIAGLGGEQMVEKINDKAIFQVFTETLPAIMDRAEAQLEEEVYPLFNSHSITRSINNRDFDFFTSVDLELMNYHGSVHQVGVKLKLLGLKSMGIDAFDAYQELFFFFNTYNYEIGNSRNDIWHTRLYHLPLGESDIETIAQEWIDHICKHINERITWFKKNRKQ